MSINTREAKYQARCWRDKILREEAAKQVTKMLQAFLPEGFIVRIEERESEVPGFPHAPRYKFSGTFCDGRPDGSDAHFCVEGYSREGVEARLLAIIVEGRGFFPLT
jgi:hypothetical protein